ncbi:MAG TPA: hypothetical protein VF615_00380 [Longimicrobiaceae bacterium]|jgi:hypothetical protein
MESRHGGSTSIAVQVLAALLGLVYAAAIALPTLVMAGAGHGWAISVISSVGLVLVPVGAVAWVRRSRPVAIAVLFLALVTDAMLVDGSTGEGRRYFESILELMPAFVLFWGVLWLGWQLFLGYALLGGRLRAAAEG